MKWKKLILAGFIVFFFSMILLILNVWVVNSGSYPILVFIISFIGSFLLFLSIKKLTKFDFGNSAIEILVFTLKLTVISLVFFALLGYPALLFIMQGVIEGCPYAITNPYDTIWSSGGNQTLALRCPSLFESIIGLFTASINPLFFFLGSYIAIKYLKW